MSQRQRSYLGNIQGEQLKLVKVQRELESMLIKVNESINALKVEELQLKSNAINQMKREIVDIGPAEVVEQMPVASTSLMARRQTLTSHNFHDAPEYINQQEIDLDLFVSPLIKDLLDEDVEEDEE